MRDCAHISPRCSCHDAGLYQVSVRNHSGDVALAGTSAMFRSRINRLVELGCNTFMTEFFGRYTIEPAQMIAQAVIPDSR